MVGATSKASDQPAHMRSLIRAFASRLSILTEHHLEFLRLKRGCRGSSESTHIIMPHCWKSHATAKMRRSSTTTSISLIKSKTDRCHSFLKFDKSVDYQILVHRLYYQSGKQSKSWSHCSLSPGPTELATAARPSATDFVCNLPATSASSTIDMIADCSPTSSK